MKEQRFFIFNRIFNFFRSENVDAQYVKEII